VVSVEEEVEVPLAALVLVLLFSTGALQWAALVSVEAVAVAPEHCSLTSELNHQILTGRAQSSRRQVTNQGRQVVESNQPRWHRRLQSLPLLRLCLVGLLAADQIAGPPTRPDCSLQ